MIQQGATRRSCTLEGSYQEIPGEKKNNKHHWKGDAALEEVTREVGDLHP